MNQAPSNPWRFACCIVSFACCAPCGSAEESYSLPTLGQVPAFSLRDQRGRPFTAKSLRGKAWVANFMFTHCPAICPIQTERMARLQQRLQSEVDAVHFVSFSIDPERDTPERLLAYRREHDVHANNWTFVTGEPPRVDRLVVEGLKVGMGKRTPIDDGGAYDISHSTHWVLVDQKGVIRGYYGSEAGRLDQLEAHLRSLL